LKPDKACVCFFSSPSEMACLVEVLTHSLTHSLTLTHCGLVRKQKGSWVGGWVGRV
jgi:hypothetical protein